MVTSASAASAPDDEHVRAFQSMRWTPSHTLLESVGDLLLSPHSSIKLIGDQQDALLSVRRLVTAAKQRGNLSCCPATSRRQH
ncbi:hypothetical protein [Kitasatospora purpeofusca]|uniref:hypothetical protein n=1 Tax=Kitasatospora purpeofusca TaxID=67352 RepID=UPI003F4A98BC